MNSLPLSSMRCHSCPPGSTQSCATQLFAAEEVAKGVPSKPFGPRDRSAEVKAGSKQLFLVVQKAVLLQKVGPHQVGDVLHLPPRHQHLHLLHHHLVEVHQQPCASRPCKASASAASALVETSTKAQNGSHQSSDLEGCGPRRWCP